MFKFLLGSDAGISYTAIGRVLGWQNTGNIGKIYKTVAEEFKSNSKTRNEIVAIREKYGQEF
jgi:hypothetical protein